MKIGRTQKKVWQFFKQLPENTAPLSSEEVAGALCLSVDAVRKSLERLHGYGIVLKSWGGANRYAWCLSIADSLATAPEDSDSES